MVPSPVCSEQIVIRFDASAVAVRRAVDSSAPSAASDTKMTSTSLT
jgi:hypothetical protein